MKNHSTVPLGAHMSIAGGIQTAVDRALSIGCTALQVFTKNSNQWQSKPLRAEDILSYKSKIADASIEPVVAHDSYLINLCSSNPDLLIKSRTMFIDELQRCEQLGIPYLNFHPGAHGGAGTADGIQKIVESLNAVHEATPDCGVVSVVETTAGQGTSVGRTFEEIAAIVNGVDDPSRMAVCIDTCHIFAAGYDIATDEGYEKTIGDFDAIVGIKRLAAFHVNDSKKGLGSRVDRHEHIGKGAIGIHGFRLLMNDPRFAVIPKILETPKSNDLHEDVENMTLLRSLIRT
jgi:deoxyribonuclease IV